MALNVNPAKLQLCRVPSMCEGVPLCHFFKFTKQEKYNQRHNTDQKVESQYECLQSLAGPKGAS